MPNFGLPIFGSSAMYPHSSDKGNKNWKQLKMYSHSQGKLGDWKRIINRGVTIYLLQLVYYEAERREAQIEIHGIWTKCFIHVSIVFHIENTKQIFLVIIKINPVYTMIK